MELTRLGRTGLKVSRHGELLREVRRCGGLELVARSGFSAKKSSAHAKLDWDEKQGRRSGAVRLVVRALRSPSIDYWQSSKDGVLWIDRPETPTADTWVRALTPGLRYWFRYRRKVKAELGDWSDTICLLVR